MRTYTYNVYYKSTPKNKHRGSVEADSDEEAIQKVRNIYFSAPVEVELLLGNGDEDATALVVDNPGPNYGKE